MGLQAENFQRCKRTWFQQEPEPVPSIAVMHEIAACPSSPMLIDESSALPSPTSSLLQSVIFLVFSRDASPCMPDVVLNYCTFRATVL